MYSARSLFARVLAMFSVAVHLAAAAPQNKDTGTLRGTVTIKDNGAPVIAASIMITRLERSTQSDVEGKYEIRGLPPGKYDVVSHMHALTDETQTIEIVAGQTTILHFQLSFAPLHHEITVTATGHEETVFESFQAVTSLDSFELVGRNAFALGEVVKNEPGVATRSFGPGSERPVLRGFDGDRVLVLADGLPTGTLSSQSGEHAEPINAANLDRLEIVKGPATLLYGSNAIGGVVNAITEHHMIHEHRHEGLRGQITIEGGSNNNRASGGGSAEYGFRNWLVWGSGNRQVASDYSSPEGRVENSKTRLTSGNVGSGYYGKKPFFSLGYYFNEGRFGIPFAGEFHHHHEEEAHDHKESEGADFVDETFTWQNVRLTAGVLNLDSVIQEMRFAANFSRWMHKEVENDVPVTSFDNKLFNLRGTFEQRRSRPLKGTIGFHVFHRDYLAQGEEALTPPVASNGIALFTLQEVQRRRLRFQFGGRIEYTGYNPVGLPHRSFTGFSGAAGVNLPLWKEGSFVANYTHSHRAPALEELYSYGPHVGNLAFERGNANLTREMSDGVDFSLRHHGAVAHAHANLFYYHIQNFVYLGFTGEVEHGLRAADYDQNDARFVGGEAQVDLEAHPNLWINLGVDAVNAELTRPNTPLPRIPPLRGRFGIDAGYKGFALRPMVIMASHQSRFYPTETRTPGYTLVNLQVSYIYARAHSAHVLSFEVFNLGDRLYRNHLSFIKDLAPEMGRGLRFSYSLKFY